MAREIKANYLSVTGKTGRGVGEGSEGVPFESTLERDLVHLVRFHRGVKRITSQPFTIPFVTKDGRKREYTPDYLVEFYPQRDPTWPSAILYEVKYRKDLWRDWHELRPKLRAARRYAKERGWLFKIMSEVEIRTPYLENIQFLRTFREDPVSGGCETKIVELLSWMCEADVETIATSVSWEDRGKAEAIGTIWSMVATGKLETDLLLPFTNQTRLWLPGPQD